MQEPLSPREREVVALLAVDGPTNGEIGQRMYLSEKTIKQHLGNAMRKTGARNRTHLAVMVARTSEPVAHATTTEGQQPITMTEIRAAQ